MEGSNEDDIHHGVPDGAMVGATGSRRFLCPGPGGSDGPHRVTACYTRRRVDRCDRQHDSGHSGDSVVIDRPVDPNTLEVGDVATYQKAPGVAEFITHRVVAIHPETNPVTFTFKGDANRGPDITPVPATAIRGKVWFHVPYLGGIRDSLHAGGLRGVALLLVIVGLGSYAIFQIVGMGPGPAEARCRRGLGHLTFRLDTAALDGIEVADLADVLGGSIQPQDPVERDPHSVALAVSGSTERLAVIRALLDPFCHVVDEAMTRIPEPASSATETPEPETPSEPGPSADARRRARAHRLRHDDG